MSPLDRDRQAGGSNARRWRQIVLEFDAILCSPVGFKVAHKRVQSVFQIENFISQAGRVPWLIHQPDTVDQPQNCLFVVFR
jgi:hypothetical protein